MIDLNIFQFGGRGGSSGIGGIGGRGGSAGGSGGGTGGGSGVSGTTRSSAPQYVSRTQVVATEIYDLIRVRNGREYEDGTITGAELLSPGYSYNASEEIWRNPSSNRYKIRRR